MIKLTYIVIAILEAFIVNSICAYQYALPECSEDAVCSEIVAISSGSMYEQTYYPVQKCKCPSFMYCPKEPGSQTISVNKDRWYGLCRPVSEIKTCQKGEVAEEVLFNARDIGDRIYTTIHCTCPSQLYPVLNDVGQSALGTYTKDNDIQPKLLYQFICMEDGNLFTKRGNRGSGRRFYFY
ncbi:hypothetical protein ACJMK2_019226 [Sinanodonta woodiana]|uniref:Uncharacterized protein n=1 Tax=Sinanodonta woodiana TaxID=1069815 RepID=A0ABD3UFR3_SINWO